MAQAADRRGILYQNLIDAGCSTDKANRCLMYFQNRDFPQLLTELSVQKATLLKTLHESEKQIDCLDFLIYDIHKKHKGEL